MRPLTAATITFITHGENKEPGTVVHVFVTSRDATTATPDRHTGFVGHRLDEERYEQDGDLIGENRTPYLAFGLGLGANTTFADGSQHPFGLGLGAFDLDLDDVVLPAVAIHILPDGSDRWIFDYVVKLFFTASDGSTQHLEFRSARDGLAGIVLDQDNPDHYAILEGDGLLPAPPPPAPETDAVLDRVTIEFATHHDDKKAGTRLNLHVVNRLGRGAAQDLAVGINVLPGKRFEPDGPLPNRRDRVTWSASPGDLPLAAPGIRLADIVLPVVYVVIDPPGHDRWIFDYEVTYEFTDPRNAGGKRHVFTSRTEGVVVDQVRRKHEGVYNGRPFPAVAPATAPPLTARPVDHREPFPKIIPIPYLRRKFDEFVNGRGGPIGGENPSLLRIRLDNSGNFAHDTTPESYLDLQGLVTAGTRVRYVPNPRSIGQLDHAYFLQDVECTSLKLSIDPASVTPLTLTADFETAGPVELPSKFAPWPNVDIGKLTVAVDLTLGIDRGVDVQGGKATLVDLLSWVHDIQTMTFVSTGVGPKTTRATGTFLGQPVDVTLPVDVGNMISFFVAKVIRLSLDTDSNFIVDGILRNTLLSKIYGLLTSPDRFTGRTVRDQFNAWVTSWLLGGIADDAENTDGGNCVLDGIGIELADPAGNVLEDRIRISYAGPRRALVPVAPAGWPEGHEVKPGPLAAIEHIVVLTMENRSFDHMLGYLSMSASRGGAGRDDVDGLTGDESNPHQGQVFGTFPLDGTVFSPDPPHGHAPVVRAIHGGAMDGFVSSFAEQHGDANAGRIMGHHTAATVPQFDALARDFAIGHRWFASHPGPTFCNRFYQLTGRLNLNPQGFWEFDNTKPIRPVFTPTIFDYLTGGDPVTGQKLTWRYFESGYCFLRFFEKYTFDDEHIAGLDDPKSGFFALAAAGRLPQVTFIDPHFVELPPGGNCDGPPADVARGQELVQRVAEAVVASPRWEKTMLVIVYDEHGGFYDHVPPPRAAKVTDDLAVGTLGLRVPAFVVSPWVAAGSVFGHDADPDAGSAALHFDHTSLLSTIARRFLGPATPYLGARFAAAADLSSLLLPQPRRPQFLPFIRYRLRYEPSQQMLAVRGGDLAAWTPLVQETPDGSAAQDFSFEDADDGFVRIRSHAGRLYLSVYVSGPDLAVRQDVAFPPAGGASALQRFKLVSVGINSLTRNHYLVSCEAYPDLVLRVADPAAADSPAVLGPRGNPGQGGPVWIVTSPALP